MTPAGLLRAHEQACRLLAYAGNAGEAATARRTLDGFAGRQDLKQHAEALLDSGIAGTPIRYRFFWPMASWLAARCPERLTIDWSDDEFAGRLAAALPLLVTAPEAEALRRSGLPPQRALALLRGTDAADGAFLVRRIGALPGDDFVREAIHDALDVTYRLEGSPDGPSRTRAFFHGAPRAYHGGPVERQRPDLATELRRPPRAVRPLGARDGARLIDLAREAMVTRSRDLDAFAHGDPRDVLLVDDGDGLAFGFIGVVPKRRLFLPAVYGALTLRNGVPIGYVQADVLFGNAEVSYNTFETFRGGEAGFVFCRLLATMRHLFGVRSYSIEPYQLGHGNEEGLESGAWWFYARFGFRPREARVARLARTELEKKKANPAYRSGRRTLMRLAAAHVFWPPSERRRATVTPIVPIGFTLSRAFAAEAGADREAAVAACAARVASKLGAGSRHRSSPDERHWWRLWAPMLDRIAGLDRWNAADKRKVVAIVRAKGGRSERTFARLFDAHPRLGTAILTLARGSPKP